MLSARDRQLVERTPLLAALPAELLQRLLAGSRVRSCERAQCLFLQGEAAVHLYLLLEGWVKVCRTSPDGQQTVLHIISPGETFAEPAAFNLRHYPASAEAACAVRALAIPGALLTELLREQPDAAIRAIGLLSQRIQRLVSDFERWQRYSTPKRLGLFLLELLPASVASGTIDLPYDKQLVAARLGMSPESLSRALARLRQLGVVNQRQQVHISDVAKLRQFVQEEG